MSKISSLPVLALGLLAVPSGIGAGLEQQIGTSFVAEFLIDKGELRSTGRNPYFILEPGYQLVLEEKGHERLTVTVLDETKLIAGVVTRVVEERETVAGRVVERSRNYFAISGRTNDVFQFGEHVDVYSGGRIINHGGSWLAGVRGARFGLMMPGQIRVNAKYYRELSPGVAMDRFAILGTRETVKTPAGDFKDCLKIEETTPLEPDSRIYKYYSAGVGLVQSESMTLIKYGTVAVSTK